MNRARIAWIAACCLPTLLTNVSAADEIKDRYAKSEHMVPMRDGVRLHTSVYAPRDRSRTYPFLIERTPYGSHPYGANEYPESLGPSEFLSDAGYIFVQQDVRGCFLSEGEFQDLRPHIAKKASRADIDESSDAYDTIDWLVKNIANHNGKAGLWGISYPGFYATHSLIDAHPALAAASPQAPVTDWFLGDDSHHNGAFFLLQEFNFDASFDVERRGPTTKPPEEFRHGSSDAYAFFLDMGPLSQARKRYLKGKRAWWDQLMSHGVYDDFWKARTPLPHLRKVKPAVLSVGGWFDAEDLWGALHTYEAIEKNNPGIDNFLVMGPWSHGGWNDGEEGDLLGKIKFRCDTKEKYQHAIEFAFFEHFLKGSGGWKPGEAFVFETGRDRWRREAEWPPRRGKERPVFLEGGGRLSFAPPAGGNGAFDEFTSDPAKPTPFTSVVSIECPGDFMVEDQRFASRRPDVIEYRTEPLSEDLTVAGPVGVDFWAETSGTDMDLVVKLIDAFPEDPDAIAGGSEKPLAGYEMLVRGDVMRGKFRESFERPKAFTPNEPARIAWSAPDICHAFRKGHRVVIQVQASWFPLVDRNPQKFVDIYQAKASDFQSARVRIHRGRDNASHVTLRVLPSSGE